MFTVGPEVSKWGLVRAFRAQENIPWPRAVGSYGVMMLLSVVGLLRVFPWALVMGPCWILVGPVLWAPVV